MHTPIDARLFVRKLLAHASEQNRDISELATFLRIAASLEVAEGGPYALPDSSIDFGLNLAIWFLLHRYDAAIPKLTSYLQDEVRSGRLYSTVLEEIELQRLLRLFSDVTIPTVRTEISAEMDVHLCAFWDSFSKFSASMPSEFQERARTLLERIMDRNTDTQMYAMPLFMRQALGKRGKVFTDAAVGELGFVSSCFWASFIVYDDFWDQDEAASPQDLPIANWLAAKFIEYFLGANSKSPVFKQFFLSNMDRLHAANTWEVQHCRLPILDAILTLPEQLPSFGERDIKYRPVAGHIMAPVFMLSNIGLGPETKECAALISYFKHYLIAMQLNDDLHDWKEDLERGHVSTVVETLLSEVRKDTPSITQINVAEDMEYLEELYWNDILPTQCNWIVFHTRLARLALERLRPENPEPLEQFISKNESAAYTALKTKEQSEQFINAVKNQEIF